MGEPGVGRMRDRLFLDSGIYRSPFEIFGVDRPGAVGHREALLQQPGDLLLTQYASHLPSGRPCPVSSGAIPARAMPNEKSRETSLRKLGFELRRIPKSRRGSTCWLICAMSHLLDFSLRRLSTWARPKELLRFTWCSRRPSTVWSSLFASLSRSSKSSPTGLAARIGSRRNDTGEPVSFNVVVAGTTDTSSISPTKSDQKISVGAEKNGTGGGV